jgi:hypothetical protein
VTDAELAAQAAAQLKDTVPLPENLSHCGCPHAPGRHLLTCKPALEFDATDLRDRPEYELGRRFAAIAWEYPFRVTATQRIDVELDVFAVILKHADEYEAFQMDASYHEWEKPMVWLSQQIEEQYDVGGVWFGDRKLSHDSSYLDDMNEHPRWTPEDTARLNEALAKRPNPNQGVLDVGGGTLAETGPEKETS